MKILVTGAKGFIGRNLCAELKNRGHEELIEYDQDSSWDELKLKLSEVDFIFHLAGVNRPKDPDDFMKGNYGFTTQLLDELIKVGCKAPILLSSSIQAEFDNPYGQSKKAGEDVLKAYSEEYKVPVFIFRLANLFGKWSRPNYNSVTATFCHNIARGLPIQINDPEAELGLVYIDDVVATFIQVMDGKLDSLDYLTVEPVHKVTLGRLAELIESFKQQREDRMLPDLGDPFIKKLYSTYLSYLPDNSFSYPLLMHADHRGSFTEFLRSQGSGQVSINVSRPGISKGDHWHHTKIEKFLVVSGKALIRFRRIDDDRVITYEVSDEKLEVVDIPVGFTHDIVNVGERDLITVMWANENFDPERPDTYTLPVEEN